MCGYWAANVISDVLAAYVPMILILVFNFAFSLDIQYAYLFLLLYPLAVIPFSYITSFIFTDDTTAQICTLFINFLAGALYMLSVYIL